MTYEQSLQEKCEEVLWTPENIILKFSQHTSFHEITLRSLSAHPSLNILAMNKVIIDDKVEVRYPVSNLIPLSSYLQQEVSRTDFLMIFYQITQGILKADNYYANMNSFLIDEGYIFIEPMQKRALLMYVPVDIEMDAHARYTQLFKEALKHRAHLMEDEVKACMTLIVRPKYKLIEMARLISSLIEGEYGEAKRVLIQNFRNPNQTEQGKFYSQNQFNSSETKSDLGNQNQNSQNQNSQNQNSQNQGKNHPNQKAPYQARNSSHDEIPIPSKGMAIPVPPVTMRSTEKNMKNPDFKISKKKMREDVSSQTDGEKVDWSNFITHWVQKKLSQRKQHEKTKNDQKMKKDQKSKKEKKQNIQDTKTTDDRIVIPPEGKEPNITSILQQEQNEFLMYQDETNTQMGQDKNKEVLFAKNIDGKRNTGRIEFPEEEWSKCDIADMPNSEMHTHTPQKAIEVQEGVDALRERQGEELNADTEKNSVDALREANDIAQKSMYNEAQNEDSNPVLPKHLENQNLLHTQLMQESKPLAFICREGSTQKIKLQKDVFRIGRDSNKNDLVLNDPKVSQIHAEIVRQGDSYHIIDKGTNGQGSTNGVFLNETRIGKMQMVLLRDQDVIRIANQVFVFQFPDS